MWEMLARFWAWLVTPAGPRAMNPRELDEVDRARDAVRAEGHPGPIVARHTDHHHHEDGTVCKTPSPDGGNRNTTFVDGKVDRVEEPGRRLPHFQMKPTITGRIGEHAPGDGTPRRRTNTPGERVNQRRADEAAQTERNRRAGMGLTDDHGMADTPDIAGAVASGFLLHDTMRQQQEDAQRTEPVRPVPTIRLTETNPEPAPETRNVMPEPMPAPPPPPPPPAETPKIEVPSPSPSPEPIKVETSSPSSSYSAPEVSAPASSPSPDPSY